MLMPQADAGAFYRNTTPALASIQSMVAQDEAKRSKEDAEYQVALKNWYAAAMNAEKMNTDIAKANQREIGNARRDQVASRRGQTHYWTDAQGKLHADTVTPAGATDRVLGDAGEKEKGGKGALTDYQRYRMGRDEENRKRDDAEKADRNKREAIDRIEKIKTEIIELEGKMNAAKKAEDWTEVNRLSNAIKTKLAGIPANQREGKITERLNRRDGTGYTITDEGKEVPVGKRTGGYGAANRGKGF